MKTETKEYNANYIVVGSDDTYRSDDDDETSITRGARHIYEKKKKPQDRVSLLRNIYTNLRMFENDPGPKKIERGMRRRVTRSHCLTGSRISGKQDHHRLNEWMGKVHFSSTAYTFWPDGEVVSNKNLGARPKVPSDSQQIKDAATDPEQ